MELNEMKKELFYEPKHAMETVDETVVKAADDFCEGYKAYLDFAKIERESVEFFVAEAEKRGRTAPAFPDEGCAAAAQNQGGA